MNSFIWALGRKQAVPFPHTLLLCSPWGSLLSPWAERGTGTCVWESSAFPACTWVLGSCPLSLCLCASDLNKAFWGLMRKACPAKGQRALSWEGLWGSLRNGMGERGQVSSIWPLDFFGLIKGFTLSLQLNFITVFPKICLELTKHVRLYANCVCGY